MTLNMSALAYPDLQIRVYIGVLACWHGGSKALDQEDLHGPCMLKGLAMIFAGQKTQFIILRGNEIYYIFQNK